MTTYFWENSFNTGIVLICIANLFSNNHIIRLMRVLCSVRLVMIKSMRKILRKIVTFSIIPSLFIFTFALLGQQIFDSPTSELVVTTVLSSWTSAYSQYPFFLSVTAITHFMIYPLLTAAVLDRQEVNLDILMQSTEPKRFRKLLNYLEYPILITILVTAGSLALGNSTNLQRIDSISTGVFTLEVLIKIIAYDSSYFMNPWNVTDFLVTMTALLGLMFPDRHLHVCKVIRIGRVVMVP